MEHRNVYITQSTCSFLVVVAASANDRRCAPQGRVLRGGRRRLHPRRFGRDAHALRQVHAVFGEEVFGLRAGGLPGEAQASACNQRQSVRRHYSQFRQAIPQGEDTRPHLHAQQFKNALRIHTQGDIAERVRR